MEENKYVSFTMETINRAEINAADYNPRKISEAAKKKLRKNIKENGLVQPIIVNRRTMNVVGGHQRLVVMDELMKSTDYPLPVAFVDVDEQKEIKLNVFLNNASAQGEWDFTLLKSLDDLVPNIDYEVDLGFDRADLDIMFGEDFKKAIKIELDDFSASPVDMAKREARQAEVPTAEDYRAMKADFSPKEMREKAKAENEENGSFNLEKSDYTLTIVFPNNHEKQDFMKKIHKKPDEKYVKSTVLSDFSPPILQTAFLIYRHSPLLLSLVLVRARLPFLCFAVFYNLMSAQERP